MELQDMKKGHEITGHENAGHENAGHEHDGPKITEGREIAGEKVQFNRDNITMKCANF